MADFFAVFRALDRPALFFAPFLADAFADFFAAGRPPPLLVFFAPLPPLALAAFLADFLADFLLDADFRLGAAFFADLLEAAFAGLAPARFGAFPPLPPFWLR